MRMSDWSSTVCSSDLDAHRHLDVHISVREAIRKDRSVVVNCESAHSEREDEGVGRLFLERLDRDTGPACVDDALALLLLVATHVAALTRSAERRVGQECGSTCSYRWSPNP